MGTDPIVKLLIESTPLDKEDKWLLIPRILENRLCKARKIM